MMYLTRLHGIFIISSVLWLTSCSSTENMIKESRRLSLQGDTQAGLQYLQKSLQEKPDAIDLKVAYQTELNHYISTQLLQGDLARAQSDPERALLFYRQALTWDVRNQRAEQGILLANRQIKQRALFAKAQEAKNNGDIEAATKWLDQILAESPADKLALQAKRELQTQKGEAMLESLKLKTAFKQPISLEFRDQNLRTILEVVARSANINFIYDKDVPADLKATIFARNTTVEDALKLLLSTNQLEKKLLNENTLLIYQNIPMKQRDYQELVTKTFYITNGDIKQTLNMIKLMVKTNDVFIDERLGMLTMRDTPEAIRLAEKLIAAQDMPDPEVVLDVQVLEVSQQKMRNLGLKWPSSATLSVMQAPVITKNTDGFLTTTPSTETAALLSDYSGLNRGRIGITGLSLTANLLATDADTSILANPSIRVRSKEKAQVKVGSKIPVITTTIPTTAGTPATESINYQDVGLTLQVEPVVHLNDDVSIKVSLEVSNIISKAQSKQGTDVYTLGTRQAETSLRLASGETQILAGLISRNESHSNAHIPGIGSIPILDRLFGSDETQHDKSEIVLLITPHIVRNLTPADRTLTEFTSGTQAVVTDEPMRLQAAQISTDGSSVGFPDVAGVQPAPSQQPATLAATPQDASAPQAASSPAAAYPSPSSAEGSSLVLAAPSSANQGDIINIPFALNSPLNSKMLKAELHYDPEVFEILTVGAGSLLQQAAGLISFNHLPASAGLSLFDLQAKMPRNLSGELLIISLRAKKPAPSGSTIALQNVTLLDDQGNIQAQGLTQQAVLLVQ